MGLAMRVDDRVPNYCLRRRRGGGCVGRRICCSNPYKQLLSIPVEE